MPPAAIADPASGKLIVVIDDDALVLDGMRGILQSWGCNVVAARFGRRGARTAQRSRTSNPI